MGSNISELETPDSDLGQSLQYLIDNAKESNTVIIVSGGCTDKAKEVETEDMDTINKGNVPFFALGMIGLEFVSLLQTIRCPCLYRSRCRVRLFKR